VLACSFFLSICLYIPCRLRLRHVGLACRRARTHAYSHSHRERRSTWVLETLSLSYTLMHAHSHECARARTHTHILRRNSPILDSLSHTHTLLHSRTHTLSLTHTYINTHINTHHRLPLREQRGPVPPPTHHTDAVLDLKTVDVPMRLMLSCSRWVKWGWGYIERGGGGAHIHGVCV
jgi:hypothetical protein